MTFRELFIELADRVGRQHLPVCDDVNEISDFLGQDAVHHDLARTVVRTVYKANRCGYLDAAVDARTTLDAVGAVQGDVLRNESADLDQVALMQNLGREVAALLPMDDLAPDADQDPDDSPGNGPRDERSTEKSGERPSGDADKIRPLVRTARLDQQRT